MKRLHKYFSVYQIRCKVNDKKYIGKSWKPERRWSGHKKAARIGYQNVLHLAMRKYGAENFEFVILHKCRTEKRAFAVEMFYIRTKNTLAPNGYNLTLGGEGASGCLRSKETRKRIGAASKIRMLDSDLIRKLSENQKRIMRDSKAREKIGKANKGSIRTQESKNKIGRAHHRRRLIRLINFLNTRSIFIENRRKYRVPY